MIKVKGETVIGCINYSAQTMDWKDCMRFIFGGFGGALQLSRSILCFVVSKYMVDNFVQGVP